MEYFSPNNSNVLKKIQCAKEKPILLAKYKKIKNQISSRIRKELNKIRNQISSRIRKASKESVEYKNARIMKAKDEKEVWNIVNEVINPNKESEWQLNIEGKHITDEEQIATPCHLS